MMTTRPYKHSPAVGHQVGQSTALAQPFCSIGHQRFLDGRPFEAEMSIDESRDFSAWPMEKDEKE